MPAEISDELFERCLRALHYAPADKPSLALLLDMHGETTGLRAALSLAFAAGRESVYRSVVEELDGEDVDFVVSLEALRHLCEVTS